MNRLTDWFSQRRFLVLLGSLVLLLIVQPILLDFEDSPLIFDTLLGLVTLALLFALTRERKSRGLAWMLGVPAAGFSLAGYAFKSSAHDVALLIGHSFGIVFFVAATLKIVHSLVTAPQLTVDSVFGAICGYLLLGVSFGLACSMIDYLTPRSFEFGVALTDELRMGRSRTQVFIYYSFVTLTTVGFGDISPLSTPARTLAWVEAMIGQFYLAILVAGLVGALLKAKPSAAS